MRQIRATLGERLRDTGPTATAAELLNVFIEEGEQLFDAALQGQDDTVLLGHASVLAEQPEFASVNSMRKLVALTEKSEDLADLLRKRSDVGGITISIGAEHSDPRLQKFTVVTAQYHAAGLSGVIGVIGPTRMPYEKVISLVTHTSKLITELLD
jgi:heat-inducible transcriptional repressor